MRRILVVNRKGGVGKTTLVTNLAAAYAQGGKRTVLIDADPGQCLVVDCLTLWLNNWLDELHIRRYPEARQRLLDVLPKLPGEIILVANEVGLGVVPLGELSRRFVDEAGWLNQAIGQVADDVVFVAAGLPLKLKATPRHDDYSD